MFTSSPPSNSNNINSCCCYDKRANVCVNEKKDEMKMMGWISETQISEYSNHIIIHQYIISVFI
jgi:hypothetical protein